MKDSIQLRIVYDNKRPDNKLDKKTDNKREDKKGNKSDKSIVVGKVEAPQFSSGDDVTSTEVSQHLYSDKSRREKVVNSSNYSPEHQDLQHSELLDQQ